MDARQKAEKMVELASKIAALDETKQAWLKELTDLVNGAAFPEAQPVAPKAPKITSRTKKPQRAYVDASTRENQLAAFLKGNPSTVGQITKAKIMPQGSVAYVLRRMLVKGAVIRDGAIYKLKEAA